MKIQFCGAAQTVTGSCYYIESESTKFLVDCGAYQGPQEIEDKNRDPFPFDPSKLDYVFLTHAHFDHCGRLPILVKQGFRGRVISTQPTRDLARIVLLDAANLQQEDFERWEARVKERTEKDPEYQDKETAVEKEPLFTEQDVEEAMSLFEVYPYGNSVDLHNGCEFRMRDSGHILGSCMFEIWVNTEAGRHRKIVFSGDLGQPGARIVRDPDMIREADYVVCESTYGNRIHRNRDETVLEFLSIIKEAQKDEGNILIPSFAIERTQEILYEINLFIENRLISGLPVYLDSPMASKATEVFRKYPNFYDEDARRLMDKGDDPFDFPSLHKTDAVEESKRLVSKRGIAIIAGSGMCNGGRIIHHLRNNIESRKTHIIFVGYQVEGTLGRKILEGEPIVKIFGQDFENNAISHTLGGFSAHGDKEDLKYWLRSFGHTPKQIFITHGDTEIANEFAQEIANELGIETLVPDLYDEVKLK